MDARKSRSDAYVRVTRISCTPVEGIRRLRAEADCRETQAIIQGVQSPEYVSLCGRRARHPCHTPECVAEVRWRRSGANEAVLLQPRVTAQGVPSSTQSSQGLLIPFKHWFIHRNACRRSLRLANPTLEDDGDPDWIDVEAYSPHYDGALAEDALHATKGAKIFTDISNVNSYRGGEVMRIRSLAKTLSAAFLRSCKAK